MRNAVDTAHVTLREESAIARKGGRVQGVKISPALTAMGYSTLMTRAMLVTVEVLVTSSLGNVLALSLIMATPVRSPSALMTALALVAVMQSQASVHALRAVMALLASSILARRTATHRPQGTATV